MNLKNIAAGALVVLLLISCKNEGKQAPESTEPEKVENSFFSIEVEAMAAVKDDFAAYYTEDGTINFTAGKAVWSPIKGGNAFEKVVFILPEVAVPTQIRLDFGMNSAQGDIVIRNVKMDYFGNAINFRGSDFFKYFVQNELFETKIDEAAGTITIIGNKEKFITPFFNPTPELNNEVKKLTIGQN